MGYRVWRRAMLVLALAVVAFAMLASVHFDPRSGTWTPYPVHLDEYFHWGAARASVEQGTVAFGDPFSGGARGRADLAAGLHEPGFQAYLGSFQQATGIPWLDVFTFGPTAVALLLMLCIYVLLEPWNAGVEAAILVGFIPTSLRFLGPGFLVPISFALPFVVAGLWLLIHGRNTAAVAFLGIVSASLWTVHAMGALLLSAVTLLWLLVSGRFIAARLASGLVVAVVFLAAWPYYGQLLTNGSSGQTLLPLSLSDVRAFGPLPFAIAIAGAFAFSFLDRAGRAPLSILTVLVASMMAIIVGRALTGDIKLNLYDRTVTTLPIFVVLLAGIGMGAMFAGFRRVTRPRIAQATSLVVCLALAGGVLFTSYTAERETRYQVLDDARFDAYTEAAKILPQDGSLALVDGLSTMAFTAITGHPTLYVQDPSAGSPPPVIDQFFADGSNDTAFLLASRVTIVVTNRAVTNVNLLPVAPGVYTFDPANVKPG